MKRSILFSGALLAAFASLVMADHHGAKINTLTKKEKAEGWELLFNGRDLSKFRNYKGKEVSDKWVVKDGAFTLTEKGGKDIITKEQFGAFEIKLDYNISKGGNSGLMYHVTETEQTPWRTGPEIQIQDNIDGHDPQKAGWLYQLYPSKVDATNPPGEWNTLHIIISPEKCVHYMNGEKYCEYVKGSADWHAKVAASKFSKFENFGKPTKGHINLQDHGNVVSFRNVKVKRLD
ncbi:MAG: DUF1080 domain-containing protein [Verrucomicrobiales bacterium]|jgi:hypothetical protein|nr:DUF1080 domain-containing protein [Verrucomicrobiales bacterium]